MRKSKCTDEQIAYGFVAVLDPTTAVRGRAGETAIVGAIEWAGPRYSVC